MHTECMQRESFMELNKVLSYSLYNILNNIIISDITSMIILMSLFFSIFFLGDLGTYGISLKEHSITL